MFNHDRPEGAGELPTGAMGEMPMHTGGGRGVAAGPAQILGSVRSVAERETDLGKFEKVAAAFPVEGYSTDGDYSLITGMDAQLAWMRRMNRIFDSSGSGRARGPPLRMLVSRCGVSVGDLLGVRSVVFAEGERQGFRFVVSIRPGARNYFDGSSVRWGHSIHRKRTLAGSG